MEVSDSDWPEAWRRVDSRLGNGTEGETNRRPRYSGKIVEQAGKEEKPRTNNGQASWLTLSCNGRWET